MITRLIEVKQMGRAHEVRAKSMAATAAAKSALYTRLSREVYMAAKSGVPDVKMNTTLRSAVEKAKRAQVPSHVIENAINKAKGGTGEALSSTRYEGYGPGNCCVIVDALTDNVNRAVSEIRSAFTKVGGKLGVTGCVSHLFNHTAIIEFKGKTVDETLEILLETDADVRDVFEEDGNIVIYAAPADLNKIKETLEKANITDFEMAETSYIPYETIELDEEQKEKFKRMMDMLDEAQDVQDVYHNVKL